MTALLFVYPGCSTCRNAQRWLDARGVAYEARDIAREPPNRELLRTILRRSGVPLRRLFNTSGQLYRAGNYAERLATMDEDTALAELASHGMLIRRPLLVQSEAALVGFDAAAYARAFAPASVPGAD
jgi:arsenate reductase